ncbi:MAG: carbohydrate kinase family protein, partial [Ktedonobacteraceae bacterium]
MPGVSTEIVVAGHICLDIFPTFAEHTSASEMLVPGKLLNVGPAVLAVGGSVANTGLALHHLGVSTRLMGK